MATGRFILSPPAAGDWNMAVDEALMVSAASDGDTILRIYRWEEPTLSLGYFQPYDDRNQHQPSLPCPCVRRHSGGGAIVHDRELTYSLAVPNHVAFAQSHTDIYRSVHQAIIDWLATCGVSALRHIDAMNVSSGDFGGEHETRLVTDKKDQPFLCFRRRTDDDLVVGTHKILGSAQRKKHEAISQHGSLLLGQSNRAPELPGIADLAAPNTSLDHERDELAEDLAEAIGNELGLRWIPSEMSSDELARTKEIQISKFGSQTWTRRR